MLLVDFQGFTMNVGAVCKQYVHHISGYVWLFSDMPKKIRKVIHQ